MGDQVLRVRKTTGHRRGRGIGIPRKGETGWDRARRIHGTILWQAGMQDDAIASQMRCDITNTLDVP